MPEFNVSEEMLHRENWARELFIEGTTRLPSAPVLLKSEVEKPRSPGGDWTITLFVEFGGLEHRRSGRSSDRDIARMKAAAAMLEHWEHVEAPPIVAATKELLKQGSTT